MRSDLLALSDDSLIALANRGIVKRALRETVAAPPRVHESADGTVTAEFADAVRTTLPPGVAVDAASCTCAATTICRHRIMTVLAYRTLAADAPSTASTDESAAPSTELDTPAHAAATQTTTSPTEPVAPRSVSTPTPSGVLTPTGAATPNCTPPPSGGPTPTGAPTPSSTPPPSGGPTPTGAPTPNCTPPPSGGPTPTGAPAPSSIPPAGSATTPSDTPPPSGTSTPGNSPAPCSATTPSDTPPPSGASAHGNPSTIGSATTPVNSPTPSGTPTPSGLLTTSGTPPPGGAPVPGTPPTPDGGPTPGNPPAPDSTPAADDAANKYAPQHNWSPGNFTDEQLRTHLGGREFAAAQRAHRGGYRATVRRATTQDPVPSVELASVTVRFLVPNTLEYARADAARDARTDAIALAVWAFRAADGIAPHADAVTVHVGGAPRDGGAVLAAATLLAPLADLLLDGVAHVGPELPRIFATVRTDLERAGARWACDALAELLDQAASYGHRGARHDPVRTAALAAELVARQRAGARDPVATLGTEESPETPLRHLRLTGLGARVADVDGFRRLEVYLAHSHDRIVLTIQRSVPLDDEAGTPDARVLGARRTGGARIGDLAAGQVVTESALRAANRTVRLAGSRIARTSVLPSAGDWDKLPPELLVGDLEAELARLAALPPAMIRPRVHGTSVRALVVTGVEDLRYLPGEQLLQARLIGPVGSALLTYRHTAAAPGAIDALTAALSGLAGPVRYLAGAVTRHGGGLVVDPTAVVAGDAVLVPCFAGSQHRPPLDEPMPHRDPIAAAVAAAIDLSAEVVHRGVRHLSPSWFDRAAGTAAALRRNGLSAAAAAVEDLSRALTAAAGPAALSHWADTHLRLLLTAEQL